MKGLLIKDCQLVFQRRQTLVIFLLVCLVTGFSIGGSFIVGYMAFLSAIIALSTISYDDADNGMPFLMTLPVSRKTYALSKYVLGGIFCTGGWLLAIAMMLGINAVKGVPPEPAEETISSLVFLAMGFLVLDLMIPLQLKFGAEKSRIVMLVVFGGIAAIFALLIRSNILPAETMKAAVNQIPTGWYVAGGVLLCTVLTVISARVSISIISKKAY